MVRRSDVFLLSFRESPRPFRLVFSLVSVGCVLGFLVLQLVDPDPHPGGLVRTPGFLALAALVLLADLYPRVPWLADVREDRVFIWSVGLSVAAILAYGPWAAVLFPISGSLVSLRATGSRWWRSALNAAMLGVHGLVCALVFVLLRPVLQGPVAGPRPALLPWQLLIMGVVLAAVFLASNVLLLASASISLGISTARFEFRMWSTRLLTIGTALLFSSLFAELALAAAGLLPMLAAGILGVHHVESAMHRTIRRARTDPLTGLGNRASLLHSLGALLGASERSDVTVLVIDLDGFKAVNDTYGHVAGDEVLVTLARRLAAAVRPPALVARYGGDEFVVVLAPGASAEEVGRLIAALISAVEEPVLAGEQEVKVSASVGVAVGTAGTTPMELIGRADREMYRSKPNRRRSLPIPEPLWTATGFELAEGSPPLNLAGARDVPVPDLGNELLGFES